MKIITQIKKLLILALLVNNIFPLKLNSENSNNIKNTIKEGEGEEGKAELVGRLNGQIYLKGSSEKHKKSHSSSTNNSSSKAKVESKAKVHQAENSQPTGNTKVTYNSPILGELWVKYFKYTNSELNIKSPKNFFVNSGYYQQTRLFPNEDFTKGNEFIKDKNYFYLSVFKNSLVFNSSKKIQMQRNVDSFTISEIANIFENEKIPKGGIEDFGNFDEGFCLKFNILDQKRSIYIICTDTLSAKTTLKKLVRSLKIEDQHKNGIYLIDNHTNSIQNKESISSLFGPKSERVNKNEKPTDGYWIILQNWSQCSLKCGGGISTLQRMCIPAKKGGNPCQGKAILTKDCNRQPCPKAYSTSESLENRKNTEVMKPIVKIMPFTNVPQRYTLCKIKESDMMIYFLADDPNLFSSNLMNNRKLDPGMKDISVPSRVIMNNSTLSIFTGEHYETLHQTFILKKSIYYLNKSKKGCFIIRENKKSITLCPFGCERDDKEQKEWARDFDLFKNKCGRTSPYKAEEDEELKKKIQEKMNEARQKVIDDNTKINQITKANVDDRDMKIIETQTTTTAMKAIQKELNIEDLIKQEEEERVRKEEMKIKMQIDLEMKKKQCVIKAIKEKQLENLKIAKNMEAKKRIESIKESAANEVLKRRNKLKEQIEKIRKKSQLKRNQLAQKLLEVRTSIASEIGKAYKKGDKNKCIVANDSTKGRNNYCIANYSEDFSFLDYCKNSDDFCEICCNNEFGDMFEDDKEKCIKEVCPLKKTGDDDEKKDKDKEGRCITKENGKFIYQKGIQVK